MKIIEKEALQRFLVTRSMDQSFQVATPRHFIILTHLQGLGRDSACVMQPALKEGTPHVGQLSCKLRLTIVDQAEQQVMSTKKDWSHALSLQCPHHCDSFWHVAQLWPSGDRARRKCLWTLPSLT